MVIDRLPQDLYTNFETKRICESLEADINMTRDAYCQIVAMGNITNPCCPGRSHVTICVQTRIQYTLAASEDLAMSHSNILILLIGRIFCLEIK